MKKLSEQKIAELKEKAIALRKEVLIMTTRAGTGHVTSSFSCVEILSALYYGGLLKFDPQNPAWAGRDYFIHSKGHANPILYCILADLGFFPKEHLAHFCEQDALLGVLLRGDVPGVEATFGSVGCGLGLAAGIAEGLRLDNRPNKVYCLVGDAECREGAIWEAALHIGFRQLNNIAVIVDVNGLGVTHFVEKEAGIEPLDAKWAACGFHTERVNGHDFAAIFAAFSRYEAAVDGKPLAIIADTVKGKGVSFIESRPLMHGAAVKPERLGEALAEIERGLVP